MDSLVAHGKYSKSPPTEHPLNQNVFVLVKVVLVVVTVEVNQLKR